jgi:predicted nucleic acid-binding protein
MREVAPLSTRPSAILDTNVFVAAGFRRSSAAARVVAALREGRLRMPWNEATRREVERVVGAIPRLRGQDVAALFRDEERYAGQTYPERFDYVPDPADRPFAALADASGQPLVTSDEHLLGGRARARAPILTPGEFARREGL